MASTNPEMAREQTSPPIVLMSREPFDYTKWREAHIDDGLNVRQLSKKAQEYSQAQK